MNNLYKRYIISNIRLLKYIKKKYKSNIGINIVEYISYTKRMRAMLE